MIVYNNVHPLLLSLPKEGTAKEKSYDVARSPHFVAAGSFLYHLTTTVFTADTAAAKTAANDGEYQNKQQTNHYTGSITVTPFRQLERKMN